MTKIKEDLRPLGAPQSWARSHGTYIAGQAAIDGADNAAITQENKWGAGRLRLLVSTELREKFDRQRYLFNQAVWHGDLEQVRRESARMRSAWLALDRAADALGALPMSPEVWEVSLSDGTVVALVPDQAAARGVMAQGRRVIVYTLDEIATMLENYQAVTAVKVTFPGARVEAIRRTIDDLLDVISDGYSLGETLDEPLPDLTQ